MEERGRAMCIYIYVTRNVKQTTDRVDTQTRLRRGLINRSYRLIWSRGPAARYNGRLSLNTSPLSR